MLFPPFFLFITFLTSLLTFLLDVFVCWFVWPSVTLLCICRLVTAGVVSCVCVCALVRVLLRAFVCACVGVLVCCGPAVVSLVGCVIDLIDFSE